MVGKGWKGINSYRKIKIYKNKGKETNTKPTSTSGSLVEESLVQSLMMLVIVFFYRNYTAKRD